MNALIQLIQIIRLTLVIQVNCLIQLLLRLLPDRGARRRNAQEKPGPEVPEPRAGWAPSGDHTMSADQRRRDKPPTKTGESTDDCPECGGPITGITTTGPSEHRVSPCGCEISAIAALEITGAGR